MGKFGQLQFDLSHGLGEVTGINQFKYFIRNVAIQFVTWLKK